MANVLGLHGLISSPPRPDSAAPPRSQRDGVIEPSSSTDRENGEASDTRVRMRPLALGLATAGGAGYLPIAPGTWGSGVAIVFVAAWGWLGGGLALYLGATVASIVLGVWAADATERIYGKKDDGRIVIDEVAGQWLTLLPVAAWASDGAFFPSLVTGFVLFRLLDIAKPGPIRWAERNFPGGVGVMADDVVAGLMGAVVMFAGLWMFGGLA
jgi:phosphatidylglycerophosphatase A